MQFFTDITAVKFTCLEKAFNVSSVFCQFQLPFMDNPITVRWYGVIIAFGFTLAVLFGGRMAYKWKIDLNKMIDVLIFGAFGGIIGARAYYVLSEWDYYGANPGEIFQIWHGGLAIYGGLIGGLIGGFIVCKIEKINILNLLDLCGMSFLVGQGIGRWGNFANQEAFGTNTDLPWGMFSEKTEAYLSALVLSGADTNVEPSLPVHPTFLYESLWCLLSFLVLYIVCRRGRKFSGQLFLMYGVLYGLERAVVEGLRTDSLYLPGTQIRTSQLLSVILASVCMVLLTVFFIKFTLHPKPIEGVDYFNEIPLYGKLRAAADCDKQADKLEKKLEAVQNDSKKAAALEEKIKKLRSDAERARLAAEKKKAAKAAKKAEKAERA